MEALEGLLRHAFPNAESLEWPDGCLVRAALGGENQGRWDDVAAIATRLGAAKTLSGEIRRRHKVRPRRKSSSCEFDNQFIDAMVECEALAWASEVAQLGQPRLTANEDGMPDVTIDGWGWVEAKAVHASDRDQANWADMRAAGRTGRVGDPLPLKEPFFKKLQEHTQKALDQWGRRGGRAAGRFAIFVHILQVDTDVFETPSDWRRIEHLAQSISAANHCRVTVIYNFDWQVPRIDSGNTG